MLMEIMLRNKGTIEYLRGFHKRKNERKKLAMEKNDKRVLEDRKELLKQVRESTTNHLRHRAIVIPEIQDLVDPQIFDLPEHTVTVANIADVDFVGNSGLRLGQNTGKTEVNHNSNNEETTTTKPVKNKSLRQQLAACSSQLSSQKIKAKKMKKKHMLREKCKAQKKGHKKGRK